MSDEMLKFLINSSLLIILLLAVYYLSVKFNLGVRTPGKGEIRILDRYPLSRETSLLLFQVRDKIFLCYQSKDDIKVLREWNYEKPPEIPSDTNTTAG